MHDQSHMRLFGLVGFPLTHSWSSKYFTEKFQREGLVDCRYELFPILSADELKNILWNHPHLEGLNVTIPHKRDIIRYLDSNENIPFAINACNCIRIKEGKLTGYNTDWIGFEKSITPLLAAHHKEALVLGNGGSAAAVIYVLKKLGIPYQLVSRKLHDQSTLTYQDLDERLIKKSLLIINTSPVGMYPETGHCPDIPYRYLGDQHLLYDLVYNPVKTLFLQKGEEQGASIKNGEEMLQLQAEESWKIWNS